MRIKIIFLSGTWLVSCWKNVFSQFSMASSSLAQISRISSSSEASEKDKRLKSFQERLLHRKYFCEERRTGILKLWKHWQKKPGASRGYLPRFQTNVQSILETVVGLCDIFYRIMYRLKKSPAGRTVVA